MYIADGATSRRLIVVANNHTCLIHLNRLSRRNSGCIMTGKISIMSNSTMINESLRAREIVPSAIEAYQLNKLTVRLPFYDHGACLILRLRVPTRKGLQ